MKRFLALILLCVLLTGCSPSPQKTEIIVFAAASLTETLTQLGDAYMAENDGVRLVFNFDSSGTLKTQIQQGANCDIFISAGQAQMDALLPMLLDGSHLNLLENRVVLTVPEGNPARIETFDQLAQHLIRGTVLLAIGNTDVPAGQYAQNILAYYGLDETSVSSFLTYGSNVKEVTTQVSEAMVDCGIVYATDAFSAGLTVIDTATSDMCGQVIYPAAIIKASRQQAAAAEFLDYLCSDTADIVFETVGFTPLG